MQRLLDSLVQVRRTGAQDLLSPADRKPAGRRWHWNSRWPAARWPAPMSTRSANSLAQIDGWLLRLYPDSPLLRERRQHLKTLRALPLSYELPIAGSTLQQLQDLRRSRQDRP